MRWQWAAGSLAAGIAGLAITLGAVTLHQPPAGMPSDLTVLMPERSSATADEPRAEAGPPVIVASVDRGRRAMSLRQVAGKPPAVGRAYVVWIEKRPGDNPVALGALDRDGPMTRLSLPPTLLDTTLAPRVLITSEATGRPSWDRPRGPVLAAGTLDL